MAIERTTEFVVGNLYSNEEIYRSLSVGNAGGIRVNVGDDGVTRRIVIMTANPDAKVLSENPYHDRIENGILIYTGSGLVGDQAARGANSRLAQQFTEPFPIWGFQIQSSRRASTFGPKRWLFLGLMQLVRSFAELQIDVQRSSRRVRVFELRPLVSVATVPVEMDRDLTKSAIAEVPMQEQIDASDREVAVSSLASTEGLSDETLNIEEIRRKLLVQEPREFEVFLGQVLQRCGFTDVEVTRYSQDGGIDLSAYPGPLSWPIRHILVQIQAKRWHHTVGRREVAELRGSILPHSVGCIVTTSQFSRAALIEANVDGKAPISLVNGHELAKIVIANGIAI